MRYLVFGDVHGNLVALDAVLEAGRARGAEGYLFVGDLVGYGPNPLECLERILPFAQCGSMAWVLGNHELVVRGDIDPAGYSVEALQTLEWTRKLFEATPVAKNFLESGHLTAIANDTIWLTHDSLANPSGGGYHRWPQNAKHELASLRESEGRVCFYGHTHKVRAELSEGDKAVVLAPMIPHQAEGIDPHPIRLRTGDLGWIGTGSVGFPTNPQRRPEFLILDETNGNDWHVEKYDVAYDREKARECVRVGLAKDCSKEVVERIARWL
jgi:predicted phosphodiesterase